MVDNKLLETHFDRIIGEKERQDYVFDSNTMGIKDRRIASTLTSFGLLGRRCLDVGPGTGRWLQFMKMNGAEWLGAIDISNEVLERCGYVCDYTEKLDLENDLFSLDDHSVDVITAIEVLEHIHAPLVLIAEIRRVLKTDGIVLMTIPNIVSFISRLRMIVGLLPIAIAADPTHVRFYRKKDLVRMFRPLGFEINFVPTSFSLSPINPKSKFRLKSNQLLSSLDDSLVFKLTCSDHPA